MLPKKSKINLFKIFLVIAGIFLFFYFIDQSFAINPSAPPKPNTLPGPDVKSLSGDQAQRSTILDLILPNFTVYLIGFIGAAALLFIIIGGLRMVVAFGNDDAVGNGKNQVKWGIIGLIVSLLSYTVVRLIVNLEFNNDQNNDEFNFEETNNNGSENS